MLFVDKERGQGLGDCFKFGKLHSHPTKVGAHLNKFMKFHGSIPKNGSILA